MMRTALTIFGFTLVLALGGCQPPSAEAPANRQWIAAVGNLNNLDVIVAARTRGAEGFQYWQRDARGIWRPGGAGQGEAAAFAAWREELVVFFSSGRYGLFGPGNTVVEQSPVPSWAPVAACEDGLALDAFGWNTAGGEPIHARYEDGKWSSRRAEVAMERDKVLDPCAIRFAGRLYIIWREEMPTLAENAAGYGLRFAYLDKGKWMGPLKSRLRVGSAPRVAANGGVLACLYQKPAGDDGAARWSLATYATTDEDWHESGDVAGAIPAGPLALGRQGARFFVAAMEASGPEVAPLEMPAGPREPPRLGEFAALAPAETPPQTSENLVFLASVAMLALLLVVLSRQRARMGAGAPAATAAPTALVPASILRRAVAIAVDQFLISIALAPVWQGIWPDVLQRMDLRVLVQRVMEGDPSVQNDMFLLYVVWSVVIVAYTSLAEGLFGRTLGKHLLGIEVRSVEGGSSVTWRQAVVRNAMRVIDELPGAYLVGLISIIVGPKPQRLGDRLAGTMVVMRSSAGPRR
jgi:uncharacterized RDD family membrane protein YckC